MRLHRRFLVIQGEGGVAGGARQQHSTERKNSRTHAPTIQKLDYRHPTSSKADFSASVNMLRGLSQIFFLLLLFGKLRPVSIEQSTFCFSHDMILNWRLLESSFGDEEVETNTDARTHADAFWLHAARLHHTNAACSQYMLQVGSLLDEIGHFCGIYGQFNLFPAPLLSSLECSVSQPVIVGGIGVAVSSGHYGNGLLCPPSSVSSHSCLQRRSMWTRVQAGTHLDISSHSQAALMSDSWERRQGISKKFLPARLRGDGDWNCDGFI